MTDKKDLIKNFIAEVKQRKFLDELYKKNTIEFDNYFKRSKKTIEEEIIMYTFRCEENYSWIANDIVVRET